MDTLQAVFTRRSIRHFTPDEISEGDLETLLKAAMSAPSARNEQPWHFVVIQDRTLLDQIPTVHPYAKMVLEAPLAILVCADETMCTAAGYWLQDCSAATQNLLLAAHAVGLGAVWLGIHPNPQRIEAMRALFHLPPHIQPVSLIAIGHPSEHPAPVDRFNLSRIHHNRF